MLRFSMSSMTLSGGTRLTFAQAGHSIATRAVSLAFTGHITLYATKISGDLNGHMVIFTPQHPPSKLSQDLTLTNVIADQPYALADALAGVGLVMTEIAD
jgi:hypothetical protein